MNVAMGKLYATVLFPICGACAFLFALETNLMYEQFNHQRATRIGIQLAAVLQFRLAVAVGFDRNTAIRAHRHWWKFMLPVIVPCSSVTLSVICTIDAGCNERNVLFRIGRGFASVQTFPLHIVFRVTNRILRYTQTHFCLSYFRARVPLFMEIMVVGVYTRQTFIEYFDAAVRNDRRLAIFHATTATALYKMFNLEQSSVVALVNKGDCRNISKNCALITICILFICIDGFAVLS